MPITRMFQNLVSDRCLEPHNHGRGLVDNPPGAAHPTPEDVFRDGSLHLTDRSAHLPRELRTFASSLHTFAS